MQRTSYLALLTLPVLLLAACAGMKTPEAVPAPPAPAEKDLPLVELREDVLYDILLAEIAGKRGHLDVAVKTLARLAATTRDPRLAERATLAALYAKQYEDGLEVSRLWVELQPGNNEARESLALVLMEVNEPAEAQLHFEKILANAESGRNLSQAYLRIASILGRHKNRGAALEVMQTLVQLNPKNPTASYALSHLAVRHGELDTAIMAIDRALLLKADWEEAALFKARILISRKDNSGAQSFYERFLDEYPRATTVRINYARFLVDLKQWEKAREQFKQVIRDTPNDADGTYAVGLLSLQTNRLEEAEKYLKLALRLRPENDQARIYLGQVAEQRGNFADAARWYGEISAGDYHFEAQARLGIVTARQGDLAGAREQLHRIEPQNNQQRVELALSEEQILREAKQYEEALAVLNAALGKLPNHKDLLYARALIAEKLGDIELHELDLRLLMKRDPANAHAYNALGYTLADRTNRYQEALDLIEQALALKPDDPFIIDSLGWVYYRMGKTTEAIKYLKRALELRDDAEISAHLGEVLWVTGDRVQAESVWKRALRLTPNNEALLDVIKKFKP